MIALLMLKQIKKKNLLHYILYLHRPAVLIFQC